MQSTTKISPETLQWINEQILLFPTLTEIQSQRITRIIELAKK